MSGVLVRRAPTEHLVLVASPERALDGREGRNVLAASSEGPRRRPNVVAERRNERRLLARRPDAPER